MRKPHLLVATCFAWAFGACTLFPTYGLPPARIPAQPTAADLPDAGVVILEDIGTLEFRVMPPPEGGKARLFAVLDHRRRMKILRPSGLVAADVSLPLDGYSSITRVTARSLSEHTGEHTLSHSAVQVAPRAERDTQAADLRVLQFHIPEAEVGGLIEYRYERVYIDPLQVDPWIFGDVSPVLYSEFGLVAPPSVSVDYVYGHGQKLVEQAPLQRTTDDGRERLVFIERDLPGFFHEAFMPHVSRLTPWIAVALRAARLTEETLRIDTWDSIAARVVDQMNLISMRPAEGTVMERYALVRDVLKPILLPGLGVHPPVSGEALAKGAPACSRDATSVLLQSFAGAKIEAYPAFLTGPMGPPLNEEIPSYYPFIRSVVAVRVDDRLLKNQVCTGDFLKRGTLCGLTPQSFVYLDPLCKQCAFGVLSAEISGGRALIVEPKNVHWVDMPVDPPQRHAATVRFLWEFDANGGLAGSMGGELRGSQAQALRFRLQDIEPNQPDMRAAIIHTAMAGDGGHLKVSGGKLIDAEHVDLPLGVHARVATMPQQAEHRRMLLRPIDLVGNSIPSSWRPLRRLPAVLEGPMWIETSAEVILPSGFTAEFKAPRKFSSPMAEYAAGFSRHGNTLRYGRRFVLKVHEVSVQDWPAFTEFFQQVRDAEQEGATVWNADPAAN